MCVCIYTPVFFPLLPWDTEEKTPFIQSPGVGWHMQHWNILSDPCHQLYLPCPGPEASPLLPYPQLLCLSVGGDKHRNIWCFWNVERLLFCRSFRLQPMAQNGLTCDIAAVLPSSPCGMCMDWHGALYMQPSESPAKLCPVTCCPWVSFPAVNVPSGHTAVGTAADRALCLVQHFSLQDTCAPWFSVLCRSAVMSFSVSLRSMCA